MRGRGGATDWWLARPVCIPVADVGEVAEEDLALRRTANPALVQLQVLFRRADQKELLRIVHKRFSTFLVPSSLFVVVFAK